jgi:hypothetical protein
MHDHMCISGLLCPRSHMCFIPFLASVCQFSPKICHLVSDVLSGVKSVHFFDNLEADDKGQRPTMVEANHSRQRQ